MVDSPSESPASRAATHCLQAAVLVVLMAIPTMAIAGTDLPVWRVVSWMTGGLLVLWILGDNIAQRCRVFLGRLTPVLICIVVLVVMQFLAETHAIKAAADSSITEHSRQRLAWACLTFLQTGEAVLLILASATAFAPRRARIMLPWGLACVAALTGLFAFMVVCFDPQGASSRWMIHNLQNFATVGCIVALGISRDVAGGHTGRVRKHWDSEEIFALVGATVLAVCAALGILAAGRWSPGLIFALTAAGYLWFNTSAGKKKKILGQVMGLLALGCVAWQIGRLVNVARFRWAEITDWDFLNLGNFLGRGVISPPVDKTAGLELLYAWGVLAVPVVVLVTWWAVATLWRIHRQSAGAVTMSLMISLAYLALEHINYPRYTTATVVLFAMVVLGGYVAHAPRHNPPGLIRWRPAWLAAGLILVYASAWILVPVSPILVAVSVYVGREQQDQFFHLIGGFAATLIICWGLGSVGKRPRLILAAIVGGLLSCGIAFGGELVQKIATDRGVELDDALSHCLGASLAAFMFAVPPIFRRLAWPSQKPIPTK